MEKNKRVSRGEERENGGKEWRGKRSGKGEREREWALMVLFQMYYAHLLSNVWTKNIYDEYTLIFYFLWGVFFLSK